jgi:hypothetical protein
MVVYRPMRGAREDEITRGQPPRWERRSPRARPAPAGIGDLCGLARGIVDASPGRGEGGYVTPLPGEASGFGALACAMGGGDLRGARRLAAALGYALVLYDDVVTGGRRLLVACDASEPGRGWGAILVDPAGDDVLVEVAHPGSDLKTPEVGVAVFRETRARALLVAGAHRYAWKDARCDAARAPGTPFDLAHRALLPARCVIQPHGFHREDGDYPAIVLSAGAAPPPPALVAVRRGFEEAGFEAGLWEGGDRYRSLAATKNRQGVSVREAGGLFVHLEISRKLRENGDERRRLAAVLARKILAR